MCVYALPFQISESFRRFGLKDTSQSVLAAVLHSSRSSNEVHVNKSSHVHVQYVHACTNI